MPLKTQLDDAPSLNMTPMIDCVFLLLIFFMLGTKFADPERNIRLRVPEVADATVSTLRSRLWKVGAWVEQQAGRTWFHVKDPDGWDLQISNQSSVG